MAALHTCLPFFKQANNDCSMILLHQEGADVDGWVHKVSFKHEGDLSDLNHDHSLSATLKDPYYAQLTYILYLSENVYIL